MTSFTYVFIHIDHNMIQHCDEYLIYITFISFDEFNATKN